MKVNVRAAQMEQKKREVLALDGQIVEFGIALGCLAVRRMRHFGKKRLNAFVRGMYAELSERFMKWREKEDADFTPEDVPQLYAGLRIQVSSLCIDVGQIEARYPIRKEFIKWRSPASREQRAYRAQVLQNHEEMHRAFWYAMILYLWEEYGWGKTRLTRFYEDVREAYDVMCQLYLLCLTDTDEEAKMLMKQGIGTIKEIGVEL